MKPMRPILFSTPMVKALLEGRKTQTRRIVKPQPEQCEQIAIDCASPSGFSAISDAYGEVHLKHLFGKVGDILYVRETSAVTYSTGPKMKRTVWYKADDPVIPSNVKFKWKPSIHMLRGSARLFLKITDIRVERLQDISDGDAFAEGIQTVVNAGQKDDGTARGAFKTLWQSINGEDSWKENPWVWVITFERIEKPL